MLYIFYFTKEGIIMFYNLHDIKALGKKLNANCLIREYIKLDRLIGNNPMYSTVKLNGVFYKYKEGADVMHVYVAGELTKVKAPSTIHVCFSYIAGETVLGFTLKYEKEGKEYRPRITQGRLTMGVKDYFKKLEGDKTHTQLINFLRGYLFDELERNTLDREDEGERLRLREGYYNHEECEYNDEACEIIEAVLGA